MQPYADVSIGLAVDSPAFRQRAPRVQLSDDPDTATVQTVQEMVRQIHAAAKDPLVQRIAVNAVKQFRGGPAWAGVKAESCWWWCKTYLKFKHHSSMFEAWSSDLGDPRTKLQLLISPDVLVRMNRMEGDCAIYTMMICSMLEALGLHWQIVTAAVDAQQPDIFGHVWPRALLPGGLEDLDASHGKYPGWHVPQYDLHRVWVFDQNGNLVQTSAAGRFNGLHSYRSSYGFGAVDESGDYGGEYELPAGGGSTVDLSALYPFGTTGVQTSPTSPTIVAVAAPSQSSAQWASFANNLLKQGFTLAQINAIQPGTVVTAGGILRQNPGYAVGSPTSAANLGISSSTLMLGALGIGALFIFSSMMKGGR